MSARLFKAARAEALRQHNRPLPAGHDPLPPMTEEELDEATDEVLHDWAVEAAHGARPVR